MSDLIINDFSGKGEEILDRLVNNIFVKPIDAGIPKVVGVVGKSGVGKSSLVLRLCEGIYRDRGISFEKYVRNCILIKPTDYGKKVEALLYDKELKEIFTVILDEAKFLLSADEWQQFKNKATRTITATSRAIKPMLFFIIAQKRSDIEARTRQTLDYYIEVSRTPGQRPTAKFYEVYEDKRKFNAPEFRTRSLIVTINKKGETETIIPKFNFSMVSKEVWGAYKEYEVPTKTDEVMELLREMQSNAEKMAGENDKKLVSFSKFLSENESERNKWGERVKGVWRFKRGEIGKLGYSPKKIMEIERMVKESLENFKNYKGADNNATISTIPKKQSE